MSQEKLGHALKVRFGTSQYEPTSEQLTRIIEEIRRISITRTPTDADWRRVVEKHCPSAGQYKYSGLDNSDLNALLVQAINQVKRG